LRLTWLVLLLDPPQHALAAPAITVIAAFGLWIPSVGRRPALLALATAACFLPVLADWTHVDNHDFLRAYWCLALALATSSQKDHHETLAVSARLLLAAVFGFTLVWKLALSPDFVDGRFFEFTFATDSRFADWSHGLAGLAPEAQAENRAALARFVRAGAPMSWQRPAALSRLALGTTLWVVAIESCVALAFGAAAFERSRRSVLAPLVRWRDRLLSLFAVSTYAVAPVMGFGWLLMAMGLAQTETKEGRVLYSATFGLLLLYEVVPWVSLLQALL
jgi:hypothetical protein